eukprot:4347801-Pleurochrysis_carterae.AAC.1
MFACMLSSIHANLSTSSFYVSEKGGRGRQSCVCVSEEAGADPVPSLCPNIAVSCCELLTNAEVSTSQYASNETFASYLLRSGRLKPDAGASDPSELRPRRLLRAALHAAIVGCAPLRELIAAYGGEIEGDGGVADRRRAHTRA